MSGQTLLITGGAGFIGSNFCYYWREHHPDDTLLILDALTYAGNRATLAELEKQSGVHFIHDSITNQSVVDELMQKTDIVVHFAAETHVDRSITEPDIFLQTNVLGTHTLLKSALENKVKRFHHISTDEVFGSLSFSDTTFFSENTPYSPRSPYAASKAGSDHLVRAYAETYGLPITITNCSNNYGEFQFPEKFVPLAITNLIDDQPIPIYGEGNQIRDWLYVQDHCRAIEAVLDQGNVGETYVVGGLTEDVTNLELAKLILHLMQKPESQLKTVNDRPGHDVRYRVDWQKIASKLGWKPTVDLEAGMQKTIDWYVQHQDWWRTLKEQNRDYFSKQYS